MKALLLLVVSASAKRDGPDDDEDVEEDEGDWCSWSVMLRVEVSHSLVWAFVGVIETHSSSASAPSL